MRELNRNSEENPDLSDSHRMHMTALLLSCSGTPGSKRLCLVGAGTCSDVDLAALGTVYAEIHLADLDEEVLARTIARQPIELSAKLFAHAPLELTGLLADSTQFIALQPGAPELAEHVLSASSAILAKLPSSFDVCISCCVWSQMNAAMNEIFGPANPVLYDLRRTALAIHLRTLTGLVRPRSQGGMALFATDVSSSSVFPALEDSMKQMPASKVLSKLYRDENIYQSAFPGLFKEVIRELPEIERETGVYEPWLWKLGSRTHLVEVNRYFRN